MAAVTYCADYRVENRRGQQIPENIIGSLCVESSQRKIQSLLALLSTVNNDLDLGKNKKIKHKCYNI